jgi:hypothetical protein
MNLAASLKHFDAAGRNEHLAILVKVKVRLPSTFSEIVMVFTGQHFSEMWLRLTVRGDALDVERCDSGHCWVSYGLNITFQIGRAARYGALWGALRSRPEGKVGGGA